MQQKLSFLLRVALSLNVAHSVFELFRTKRGEKMKSNVLAVNLKQPKQHVIERFYKLSHAIFVWIAGKISTSHRKHSRRIFKRNYKKSSLESRNPIVCRHLFSHSLDNAFTFEIWLSLFLSRARECFYPVIIF
jgi:hypothetical protein